MRFDFFSLVYSVRKTERERERKERERETPVCSLLGQVETGNQEISFALPHGRPLAITTDSQHAH